MDRRLEFRNELKSVMDSNELYFQPPDGKKITYPCAIYKILNINMDHADDLVYKHIVGWQVTIIDRNPDSVYPERLMNKFRHVRFDRSFTADNLNHFVFTIYY